MSNDKQQDDMQLQDEAFINSLYRQLPDESPSSTLDQRILDAAHQSVTAPSAVVKKRPHWLKPMASAAAILLVATVSLYEIFDPNAPLHVMPENDLLLEPQIMDEADFDAAAGRVTEQTEHAEKYSPEPASVGQSAFLVQSEPEMQPGMKPRKLVKPTQTDAVQERQQEKVEAETHPMAKRKVSKLQQNSQPVAEVMSVEVEGRALSDSTLAETDMAEEQPIEATITLTPQQLAQFEMDTVWHLVKQDQTFYWIAIPSASESLYQLAKSQFVIALENPTIETDYPISAISVKQQ